MGWLKEPGTKTGTNPQTLQLVLNKPAGKREPLGKEISGREKKTPPWRTICAVLTCHTSFIIDGQNGNKSIYGFLLRVLIRVQERGSLCRKAFNLPDTTPLPMVRTLKSRKEPRNRLLSVLACHTSYDRISGVGMVNRMR